MSQKAPVVFVGHGSPLNAVENNKYSEKWAEVGKNIAKPSAILSLSAHWYADGWRVNNEKSPNMVYDMYGFPRELYDVKYPSPGAPQLAGKICTIFGDEVIIDNTWGIDHGTWSVLCRMFPAADIPLTQLSINRKATAAEMYEAGRKLRSLRDEGVMIFASGNVVHNLALLDWDHDGGFSWAEKFDTYVRDNILKGNYDKVINYGSAESPFGQSFVTPDHYFPLLCALGAVDKDERTEIFNNSCTLGSLSMTSYIFG